MNQIFWYECGGGSLNNNLVGYYKFDGNITDSTGLMPSASSSGIDFVAGKLGQAVRFDAFGDNVNIPDTDRLSFTNGGGMDTAMSISLWYYITASSSTGNWIFNKRNNTSGGDEWQLVVLSDGRIFFTKFDRFSNAIIQQINTTASFNTLNTWFHLVVTYDGSKLAIGNKIYVNGTLVTVSSSTSSGVYSGMNNGLAISRFGDTAFNSSDATRHRGYIDECGIWKDRVLTQSEVTKLYNSGTGITYPF